MWKIFSERSSTGSTKLLRNPSANMPRTANISGVINADVTEKLFKIQYDLIFKNKIPIAEIIIAPAPTADLTVEYWGLLPFSRGSIHINSTNATLPAYINPNYFMLDYDVQQQVVTGKMARAFTNTAPFSELVTGEVTPGLSKLSRNASDADWAQWLKSACKPP